MRATYEDLLRTARRMAVNAQRGRYVDRAEVVAGWRAVLAATSRHLRWLRVRLRSAERVGRPASVPDNSLGRLARAIGAGADLLATQASNTAGMLDEADDLAVARSEVAAIALIAAKVVARDLPSWSPVQRNVARVMAELEVLVQPDGVRGARLGPLGGLTAGAPAVPFDDSSLVARCAARWERAHACVAPLTLLTRDLRSMTSQLRTVCGYSSYLVQQLLGAPAAGLDAGQQLELKTLRAGLGAVEEGAIRVAKSWQRRMSDLSGQSRTPGEAAFLDLRAALDRVVRPQGGLLQPAELVPNQRAAMGLLDAIDELVWSADQVARQQQVAVAGLIVEARLFVPRHEVARRDLRYLRRPGGGARLLQTHWVSTGLPIHFDELTEALAWSVDHLAVASSVASRLAGTSRLARPAGEEHLRVPPPYLDVPNVLRRTTPSSTPIADPGQEPAGLDR
ncbi:hypothetical protein AB0H36_05250 [Kribbella sp. NPDC050820]|uniref:hypothetical protein n=1 Tax=Kribbella sp. NPDC050820 TaxID=3155408 RepID=UPI003403FD9B